MKKQTATKLVTREIADLGYDLNNSIVKEVAINAIELAEIATKKEVISYIEEAFSFYPSWLLFDEFQIQPEKEGE